MTHERFTTDVMSDTESGSEPMIFPSQNWFSEYGDRVDADEEYAEVSEGWGVDFNGDFIFEMTEMPVDELDNDAMPEFLVNDLDTYVTEESGKGYTGQAYMALENGGCPECHLIEPDEEPDVGFYLRADYDTWKELMRAELGVIDGLMGGKFDLDGDMQKVLQYSDAAVQLTDLASSIDAGFADEEY